MKMHLGAAAIALGLAALTVPGTPGSAAPAAAEPAPGSPVVLQGPARAVVFSYDGYVYGDLGVRLSAPERAFELRTVRPDWNSALRTTWESPSGPVTLPASLQTSWGHLDKLVKVTVRKPGSSKVVRKKRIDACLNSWNTQRLTPAAPLRSPYPESCPYHPFTIGSVQGIQQGWGTTLDTEVAGLRLSPGKYDITADLRPAFVKAVGIKPADATRTYRLVVKKARVDE